MRGASQRGSVTWGHEHGLSPSSGALDELLIHPYLGSLTGKNNLCPIWLLEGMSKLIFYSSWSSGWQGERAAKGFVNKPVEPSCPEVLGAAGVA